MKNNAARRSLNIADDYRRTLTEEEQRAFDEWALDNDWFNWYFTGPDEELIKPLRYKPTEGE